MSEKENMTLTERIRFESTNHRESILGNSWKRDLDIETHMMKRIGTLLGNFNLEEKPLTALMDLIIYQIYPTVKISPVMFVDYDDLFTAEWLEENFCLSLIIDPQEPDRVLVELSKDYKDYEVEDYYDYAGSTQVIKNFMDKLYI